MHYGPKSHRGPYGASDINYGHNRLAFGSMVPRTMSRNYVSAHLYGTRQVASALGVNKKTIYRWLEESVIPEPNRGANGYRQWTGQEVEALRREHPRRRRPAR